jgi:serine protease inhibitor
LLAGLRVTEFVFDTSTSSKAGYLITQVNNPSNIVEAANQIFLSHTLTPQLQYESVLKKHYMAQIEKVDFSSPVSAAQFINGWVNMLTHGQIPSLVESGTLLV